MKKVIVITLALVLVLSLVIGYGVAVAKPNGNNGPKPGTDFNGPHYNLNLIGKAKVMPGDYDNPDRHTMFIPLDTDDFDIELKQPNNLGKTALEDSIKINVSQGDDWAMIDGNATDGEGSFQIAPGKYDVYIAVKAKSPKVSGAYTYIAGWIEAYDIELVMWYYLKVGEVTVSKNGKWTDASTILWVDSSEDPFGIVGADAMWVFDYMALMDAMTYGTGQDKFSDLAYFWQVDNNGNKLIQVRFYEH